MVATRRARLHRAGDRHETARRTAIPGRDSPPAIIVVGIGCRSLPPLPAKCACMQLVRLVRPGPANRQRIRQSTGARVTQRLTNRIQPERHRVSRMTPLITPTRTTSESTFAEIGVRAEIVQALTEDGIKHPFAIQELTLPLALAGDDLIGQARTGIGKTLAFCVPLLHRIVSEAQTATSGGAVTDRPLSGVPRALVVVPTRELCIQVSDDLSRAAKYLRANSGAQPPTSSGGADRPLSVVSIYGGRPYEPQIEALQAGADVGVGTPGRLLDLAQQGYLQLGGP